MQDYIQLRLRYIDLSFFLGFREQRLPYPSAIAGDPSGDSTESEVPEIRELIPLWAPGHLRGWPQESVEKLDEVVAEMEDFPNALPREPAEHLSQSDGEEADH